MRWFSIGWKLIHWRYIRCNRTIWSYYDEWNENFLRNWDELYNWWNKLYSEFSFCVISKSPHKKKRFVSSLILGTWLGILSVSRKIEKKLARAHVRHIRQNGFERERIGHVLVSFSDWISWLRRESFVFFSLYTVLWNKVQI